MKTPQEIKAKELVERYLNIIIHFPYTDTEDGYCIGTGYMTHNSAVRCAKIAVEEIIKTLEKASDPYSTLMTIEHWQEVLNCLNKL
jgi:biotin synthase-like enzyme